MPGTIHASEPKTRDFPKEKVRSWAIKILAQMSNVKQMDRKRILSHALKLNEV